MPNFAGHDHPKIIKVVFNFPEFASACKKISSVLVFILAKQQVLESHDLRATPTFDHVHPVIISYPEFVSLFKKSVYSIDSFMRYSQLKSPLINVTTPTPILFYKLLISVINIQKNRLLHHFVLENKFDLKILQSDWQSLFWPNMTEKQTNRFTAFTFG